MFNRISPNNMENRLDADFYKQEFIDNNYQLIQLGAVTLNTLISVKRSGYGVLPKSNEYLNSGGVLLIRGGDLSVGQISEPQIRAPIAYKDGKGTAEKDDILILIKGACIDGPEGVGLVSDKEVGYVFNGSCYRLSFHNKQIDSYFFVAYSQTDFFLKQKKRQVANTGISYNDEASINGYLIPDFSLLAKNYFGNKIRQTERFRVWAQELYEESLTCLKTEIGSYDTSESKFERVSSEFLDNRLDQNHYRKNLLNCLKKVTEKEHVSLGNTEYFEGLTDGDHGNPVYGKGPLYLRTNEMSGNLLYKNKLVSIDSEYAKTVGKSCWTSDGDIVFSVVGTLGLTAVVGHDTGGVMSRGIAKICSRKLPNYYVKSYFRSSYFYNQLERHSVGSVQRGVYLSALEKIVVPILGQDCMRNIADKEKLADTLSFLSSYLILAAKLLIEALIDGEVTEQQIISAQQGLESGDDSLEKELLSHLTTNGLNADGEPLFPDLDQLYDLLAQSQKFSDGNL